jgi:hypothetical protein
MMRTAFITLAIGALGVAAPAAEGAGPCNDSVATAVPQPTATQMAAAGLGRIPAAPLERRVDLVAPAFANPTSVTNPLFPISGLHSVILNGKVDGRDFRTETTLLPDTRVIEWSPGQCVETLVSQYVAYLGGHIQEVALDLYAQADDGSVWYFGEDVFNYRHGVVQDTEGTWLAGKDGPAAMIMPAAPHVGDVNRAENIPGLVWEEVAVRATGRTVAGPLGPVAGAMIGRELHDDGTMSDKVFAPGYGEFFTREGSDVEALAVAVPTDALPGPPPAALRRLLREANASFRAASAGRWRRAGAHASAAVGAWRADRAGGVPRRLVAPTRRAVAALVRVVDGRRLRARDVAVDGRRRDRASAVPVDARRRVLARDAALDVVQAALDLELRYRAPAAVDRGRLDLWARRVQVDAEAGRRAAVKGDVAVLEWIRDRVAHTLDAVDRTRIDTRLVRLRANVSGARFAAATRSAADLRRLLAGG